MVFDFRWITLNVFWFIAKWWTWSVKRWMSGVIFILGWTSALKNDNPRNHLDMKRGLENKNYLLNNFNNQLWFQGLFYLRSLLLTEFTCDLLAREEVQYVLVEYVLLIYIHFFPNRRPIYECLIRPNQS